MTTRRVQELTQKIAGNKKEHRAELAAEHQKRDQQRVMYEGRLRRKDELIEELERERRERVAMERRQSHALRASLVEVSRPTQDYYDTMIHVIIF